MSETEVHRLVAYGVMAVGAITFLALRFITAPYGRHGRGGWGPTMPERWGWVVMESPAVLGFAGIFLLGDHRAELAPLVLLGFWLLHYVNRTFVYPFRLASKAKEMPVAVVAMAIVFNVTNAYLNARQISHLGAYPSGWLTDPRFVVGALLFLGGRQVNVWADAQLLALKREGKGYQIPRAGLYRLISCPNYFGEIVEWCGWAVMTWSLAGLSFAVFTFANLAPRAISHHRWYRETFEDYPLERKAVLPWLW
ncbi:MAG: DUF1295 domain-containing protein [Polyangiaceae bacterium]